MKRKIYLDYAATSPVDPRVVEAMQPYFTEKFGNAASLHGFGQEAEIILGESRKVIAQALNAENKEIIFTSSATESNNLAVKGIAFANSNKGKHIIISSIEHDCILNSTAWLEKHGFKVTKLSVNKYGLVDPKEIKKTIQEDTVLLSVMHANNEIGTIEPIAEIGEICSRNGVYFHTDAAQTFGKIPLDVKKLKIDLLTASSHKMYGPKGAGLLFLKEGVKIEPLLHGGGHEFGFRPSTVNIPAVVGFARAVEISYEEMDEEKSRLIKLRDRLIKDVLEKIPNSHLNGPPDRRLPNNANFWFEAVEGEAIVMQLDSYGIAGSTGSACSSPKLEPSHVLLACGLKPGQAHGSLRLSLGKWTKEEDIDYVVEVLAEIVKKLRAISPFTA